VYCKNVREGVKKSNSQEGNGLDLYQKERWGKSSKNNKRGGKGKEIKTHKNNRPPKRFQNKNRASERFPRSCTGKGAKKTEFVRAGGTGEKKKKNKTGLPLVWEGSGGRPPKHR